MFAFLLHKKPRKKLLAGVNPVSLMISRQPMCLAAATLPWIFLLLLRLLADVGKDAAVNIEHMAVDCIGSL